MRTILATGLAIALLVVPGAAASGLSVSYTVTAGTPGDASWYLSAVTAQITVQGAINTTCVSVMTFYVSSDALNCSATDGNSTVQFHLQFKIDTVAPSVTTSATDRPPDANGWFNHPLSVNFGGTDATSGVASCTTVGYGGPDSATASATGTCRDNAGNVSAPTSLAIKYDATAPSATGAAARAPDAAGWFNHAVAVSFTGTDATSGIASCAGSTTYAGPDTDGASLAGSCIDEAGNSAPASVALKYDATPPKLDAVAVAVGAGEATLSWKQPADTAAVTITRSPGRGHGGSSSVYTGTAAKFRDTGLRPGVAYHYTLRSRDLAGNSAVSNVSAKLRTLYAPAPGAVTGPGEALRWAEDKRATYYNVQLFRGGRKVMSVWPVGPSLRLPARWTYGNRRYRLVRGTYRWFVWPGYGPRKAVHYGRLLGSSQFRVR